MPATSPSNPRPADWHQRIDRIGAGGLYLLAFGAWLGVALANLGLFIMAVAAIADRERLGPRLKASPWLWLIAVSVATVSASTALGWPPSGAARPIKGLALLQLWSFVLVAWWCHGDSRRAWRALGLGLAGFVLGRLLDIPGRELGQTLDQSQRTGLGLQILAFGQYCATALIGLCLAAPRLWQKCSQRRRPWVIGGWVLLIALALEGLLLSQARAVWLISLFLLPLLLLWRWKETDLRQRTLVLVLGAAMLVTFVVANWGVIENRIGAEADTYHHLRAGNWSQIGYGSMGLRLHAWHYAADLLAQRPWLGWGPGSAKTLLQTGPDSGLHSLADFHNLYIDLPIEVGLLGSLPFAVGAVLVFRAGARAHHAGEISQDMYLILIGGLVLHFLAALTNTRMLNPDWGFMWMLLAGIATAPSLGLRSHSAPP